MAKLFLTKMYGFNPESYPTFGFSEEGARRKFLSEADHGDWIVVAGTKGPPTAPEQQGRLLGMCQVGHQKINADEVLREIGTEIFEHELDANGKYRWPWAMPMIRAVRFDPTPDTAEIIGSYLPGREWATYALEVGERLGTDVVNRLKGLKTVDATIHDLPEFNKQREFADALSLNRLGLTGPAPSSSRSGSQRELGHGYAYAFMLEGGKVAAIKIGSSHDVPGRLATLNKELRPQLTGCSWRPFLQQKFTSEKLAYNFEQMLIKQFRDKLVEGEREIVVVGVKQFQEAWKDLFVSMEWVT